MSKFDVISFDIFDTLLLRSYLKPTDLFAKIGGERFRGERISAEQKARAIAWKAGREEVTFDEIYELLSRWPDMRQKELDEERRCLTANPEMREVWKRAGELGKKRVIVSDMYLDETFIVDALSKNGFGDYDVLYLSSTHKLQKSSGRLFEVLKRDFPAAKILHIGDNEHSDVVVPRSMGIGSVAYKKVLEQFLEAFPFVRAFLEHNRSLDAGMFVANLALGWLNYTREHGGNTSYWNGIGYVLGGVLATGFLSWIKRRVDTLDISRLLFVARDGYSLKKICDICSFGCDADYIYAPRSVAQAENHLVYEGYCRYISSLHLPAAGVALVDTNSIHFSSEELLRRASGIDIHGLYANALCGVERGDAWFHSPNFSLRWPNLMELLFMAPTRPIVYVDEGGPQYQESVSADESERIRIYPEISEAEVASAVMLIKNNVAVSREVWLDWIEAFIHDFDEGNQPQLEVLRHGTDAEHKVQAKIITDLRYPKWSWKRYIKVVPILQHYYRVGLHMKRTLYLFGVIPFWRVSEEF